MTPRAYGLLSALVLGAAIAGPAAAQRKPTIAIMPAQYFSADAESAKNITEGLRSIYERQGYTVIPMDRAQATWSSMGLAPNEHYADRVAVRFGQSCGADLVAYPRLLAVGMPINGPAGPEMLAPNAVLHLRVMNVHSRNPIYFRQIGHEFGADVTATADNFTLPQPVATATAQDVTGIYFERVMGSRQEMRGR